MPSLVLVAYRALALVSHPPRGCLGLWFRSRSPWINTVVDGKSSQQTLKQVSAGLIPPTIRMFMRMIHRSLVDSFAGLAQPHLGLPRPPSPF